jgi:guanylate kinase
MAAESGQWIIVSSPSGGGKTTVIREAMRKDPSLVYSVSATTRPPRAGERNGVDYCFLTESEFEQAASRGEFLEWATVHGCSYGTPAGPVRRWTAEGRTVLFDLDVQGAGAVKAANPAAVTVFLLPPDRETLRRRLARRGSETESAFALRMAAADLELAKALEYDFLIVNDRLDAAAEELLAVVRKIRKPSPSRGVHV